MGTYQSAGLYPEERSSSAGPVQGVSTSTYATVGWLRKGPVNQPQLVTGLDSFISQFGTYWRNSYVPFMMAAFFQNKGALAYVTRVVPTDAVKATSASGLDSAATAATFYSRQLADPVTDLDATHRDINVAIDGGAAADVDATADLGVAGTYALSALVTNLTAIVGMTVTLEATLGGGNRLKFVSDTTGIDSSLVFKTGTTNGGIEELLGLTTGETYTYTGEAAIDWTLDALWEGAWYNQQRIAITGNLDNEETATRGSDTIYTGGFTSFDIDIQEESSLLAADWSILETYEAVLFTPDTSDQFAPTVINDQTDNMTITEGATFDTPSALKAYHRENECMGEGDAAEVTFTGTLIHSPVQISSLQITAGAIVATDDGAGVLGGTGITTGSINYTTGAYSITYTAAPAAGALLVGDYWTAPSSSTLTAQLTGGTDGTVAISRSQVSDPALEATKEGIYSFNEIDDILTISLPDFAGTVAVHNDMIAHAEDRKDRFVVLSSALGLTPTEVVKFVKQTAQYNTSYAGIYYPWVTIADPLVADNRPLNVPPDGFIAGVYSRTDTNRNVGKAPGGINDGKINGAIGLERTLVKGERDILYPARINPLVSSPATGRAVWGARTLSKDAEWLHINVRRLFMFCEKSIENASYWVVFENNGAGTWTKMKAQGEGFFTTLFRDGYFAGTTATDAFKIVIDTSNNSQANVDAGLLTADYYIAANKPAEFVRLRFQQKVQPTA